MAEQLGKPLLPWQRLVAEVGGELVVDDETGLIVPAYRQVVFTVPRQSGKTMLVLAWEVDRALNWGDEQLIVYTAQTGHDARMKLVDDQMPILGRRLAPLITKMYRGVGLESVLFRNGSRITTQATSEDAGHGRTVHMAVRDELFGDADNRREQALKPAMKNVPDGQELVTSTAGTQSSVPLRRLVERGRAAARAGETMGLAYFEWSAGDDDDPDDPATWYRCMPALGTLQTKRVIADDRRAMADGEFRRSDLNQWWVADAAVFPAGYWQAVCSAATVASQPVVYALDAQKDLAAGAVACADSRGNVELGAHRPGVAWLADAALDLVNRHPGSRVAVDVGGPVGYLADRLTDAGVDVIPLKTRDVQHACQGMYDAVADGRVQVRTHVDLDEAVKVASRRPVGESWMWERSAGAVPLMAVTLARHAARNVDEYDLLDSVL